MNTPSCLLAEDDMLYYGCKKKVCCHYCPDRKGCVLFCWEDDYKNCDMRIDDTMPL